MSVPIHITDIEAAINYWRTRQPAHHGVLAPPVRALAEVPETASSALACLLEVRGDGRRYKFNLRTDGGFDGITHQASFQPPAGEWTVVRLPLEGFVATWRGRPASAVRLVMNRVSRSSFGKDAAVFDLDECIDTVGLQLIAAIPESRTLQRAGAAGTALPQDCPAAIAGHALAGRILGERIPLTCF